MTRPTPDLRLVDMAQVELLKGPQGPLYGTGALGGVFRLVPARPDLATAGGSIRTGATATAHGTAAGEVDAVLNLPIVPDRLGARAVAYRAGQGGWIDSGGTRDVDHGQTSGGRIALRFQPRRWTIDVTGAAQSSSIADSHYVEQRHLLARAARLAEPQDTDFTLASVIATGPVGAARLTAVASSAWQELEATYDASSAAVALGGTAPAAYRDDRRYRVTTGEVRVAGRTGAIDWLAGASLLDATTAATGNLVNARGTVPVLAFRRQVTELAVFGEATAPLTARLRGTLGLRLFRSATEDERRERTRDAATDRAVVRGSPSATLTWQANDRLLIFARYASALRPGGLQAATRLGDPATRYEADELQSVDAGARWRAPGAGLSVEASVFASSWAHVQADFLGSNDWSRRATPATRPIAASTSRSAGARRCIGPFRRAAGSARAHRRERVAGLPEDRRLPVIPDIAAHAEAGYSFDLGPWQLTATVRANFVGEARLSFDPGLDRESEPVTLASLSLVAARHGWRWRLGVDNVFDSRADTFSFGNPFTIRAGDQHTPLRPARSLCRWRAACRIFSRRCH